MIVMCLQSGSSKWSVTYRSSYSNPLAETAVMETHTHTHVYDMIYTLDTVVEMYAYMYIHVYI